MLDNLKLISAGAGSGKTYRLTHELIGLLQDGSAKPSGVIATTFTKRAAAELRERVRVELLRMGLSHEANELKNALIGTVHGLGVKLLKRFAFEAGVSPQVDIIADQDHQRLFNLSMAAAITVDEIDDIEALVERLGLSPEGTVYDWRKDILRLVEIIRGNNFSAADIERSKQKNWEALSELLPERREGTTLQQLRARLQVVLGETIAALTNNDSDGTKTTLTGITYLKGLLNALRRGEQLPWKEFCKLARFNKGGVGAKSRNLVDGVVEIGNRHPQLPAFQDDLKNYQDYIYDLAGRAIAEYDRYKKARGRIDYTDMEVLVLDLLDNPQVQKTLRRELDLLMVDEFQDTSPIQLAIFLRLSQLAKKSVWVGDPKQSIYGFRGAEPRLMRAVVEANGPMDPNNIQKNSWRSREDVVYACNAIFTKAFPDTPEAAVVLEPVRKRNGNSEYNKPAESAELAETSGVWHWAFNLDGGRYSGAWFKDVVAKAISEMLANPPLIVPKEGGGERRLRPSDIAVLCRSNYGCSDMAQALAKQGIPAAIARTGLLGTAEATLILACLKYMLNSSDSLSVAEILLFGSRLSLSEIIENRLDYLEQIVEDDEVNQRWGANDELLKELNALRDVTAEYSTNELLNILLERLDLRRKIVAWGDGEQRLSNVDELRRLAVEYEDNCHRQHRAASLPGYLLYLDTLNRAKTDKQGAGERPEAVNVLTYHKSKGLEWPAVIAMDLDQDLRAGVWGLSVVPEKEEVDLHAPLADRWIKYWVNPYGKLTSGVDWLDNLSESAWHQRSVEDSTAEDARLLYVGLTRARDYLILPTGRKGAGWLDRTFEIGGGLTPVLDPNSSDAPFDWGGNEVHKKLQTWTEPKNLPGAEVSYSEVPFIAAPRPGRHAHAAREATRDWALARYAHVEFGPHETYFTPPEVDPDVDGRLLSQAVGAFLLGDIPELLPAIRAERAQDLLTAHLPTHEDIPASYLVEQSTAFRGLLEQLGYQAGAGEITRRERLQAKIGDRVVLMTADWLVPTGEGLMLIRDVHQTRRQLEAQEDIYRAELALLNELATGVLAAAPVAAYLHLPLLGLLKPIRN